MQPDIAGDQPAAVRVFSYGGGVQSTAALVLAAAGRIDFRTFAFANVGDDHEPETLAYVRQIAAPFAAAAGLELLELRRGGVNDSILHKIARVPRSLGIPVRMDRTGAPGRRACTYDFKIVPVQRLVKSRGATKAAPATIGLGITVDEIQRVRSPYDARTPEQRRTYPLVDLELTRADCEQVILRAGLPVPPKSACYFCPFHSLEQWRTLRRRRPDQFAAAVQLERQLQTNRAGLGKDPVWLTDQGARHRLTLDQLVTADQLTLLDENVDNCDEGHCFT